MTERLETDLLTELVARKLRVLVQLRELTVRQPALIEADDAATLLRVLSAKQKLLEEVHRLDEQLEPFRQQDPDSRVWRTVDDRVRCRAAAEQCQALVEELKVVEAQDKHRLVERRDALSRELEHAHAAAEARTAYQTPEPIGRLDLSSIR